MNLFIDRNYPGVVYNVEPGVVIKFIDHMMNEGAALSPTKHIPIDWDVVNVVGVREDEEYWGLVIV